MDVFGNLMTGLERQLGGMGTAFGSSLLGLAGSLVVGLLDLLAGRGQNRFYRELEEWLSSITRIGTSAGDGDAADNSAFAGMLDQVTFQTKSLHELLLQSQEQRDYTDARVDRLMQAVERLAENTTQFQGTGDKLLEQIAYGQKQLIDKLGNKEGDEVWDVEARMRLRNIDTQLLRILEEITTSRQDVFSDLRSDLLGLTSTLRRAIGVAENPGDKV